MFVEQMFGFWFGDIGFQFGFVGYFIDLVQLVEVLYIQGDYCVKVVVNGVKFINDVGVVIKWDYGNVVVGVVV